MKMTSSSGEVDKFLKEKLIIEGKVVTFKTLSRELDLHISDSKRLLNDFYERDAGKGEYANLKAVFHVTGVKVRDDGVKETQLYTVRSEQLEKLKSTFATLVSAHVYALKMNSLQDPSVIFNAEFDPQHKWAQDDVRHASIRHEGKTFRDSNAPLAVTQISALKSEVIESIDKSGISHEKSDTKKGKKSTKDNGTVNKYFNASKKTEKDIALVVSQADSNNSSQANSFALPQTDFQQNNNEEKSPKINAAKKAITQSTKNRQKLQLVSSDEEAFDEKIGKELQDESFRETSPVAIQRRKNRSQDSNKSSAVKLIDTNSDIFSTGLSSPEASPTKSGKSSELVRRSPRKHKEASPPPPKSAKRKRKPSPTEEIEHPFDSDDFSKGKTKKTTADKLKATAKGKKRSRAETPTKEDKNEEEDDGGSDDDFVPVKKQASNLIKNAVGGKSIKGHKTLKTFMDEDGYLVTEKVFEEDDNTENSSVQPASKQPSPVKKTSPEASKTATTKKQQIKNAKQQSSLTSFFKKK